MLHHFAPVLSSRKFIRHALVLPTLGMAVLGLCTLTACSSKGKKDPYQDWASEKIYKTATDALQKENYTKAIRAYESLDKQYPFGSETEKAQLEMIYAYYEKGEMPAALRAADRFIRLHPTDPHVDYAYYLRGLIKSSESITFAARYLPLDLTQRDTDNEKQAFEYFEEFVGLYPESRYAPDARQRMIAIRNDLAAQTLHVAEYYYERGAYLAAANRAQSIIESYPQTPYTTDALKIMQDAYAQLQLTELSQQATKVLKANERQESTL